jgi:hypothetical protein
VTDSKLNVSTGFAGGISVSFRADSISELRALASEAYGLEAGDEFVDGLLKSALSQLPIAGAVANLNDGGVSTSPSPFVNTTTAPRTVPQPLQDTPPGVAHDPKDPTKTKWVPAGVSKNTGKPYQGFWAKP